MAGNTANPRIWTGADVHVAPVGTTGPTDLTTALNAEFALLGLLGEDGLSETREGDVKQHFAYGGIHFRTTKSKHQRKIKVVALEDNPVVFGLVEPSSSTATAGGITTRTVRVPQGADPRALVFTLTDGEVSKRRHVPRAEVEEVGETKISDSEAQAFELTFAVYPDGDGVLYYDITDDPQAVSA